MSALRREVDIPVHPGNVGFVRRSRYQGLLLKFRSGALAVLNSSDVALDIGRRGSAGKTMLSAGGFPEIRQNADVPAVQREHLACGCATTPWPSTTASWCFSRGRKASPSSRRTGGSDHAVPRAAAPRAAAPHCLSAPQPLQRAAGRAVRLYPSPSAARRSRRSAGRFSCSECSASFFSPCGRCTRAVARS